MEPSVQQATVTADSVRAVTPWEKIHFGPLSSRFEESTFDRNVAAKEGHHTTCLLWERQVDVEACSSFHCTAMRLETPVAVQHQSQWQLNVDPRFHELTLHWLRVVRNGQVINHLHRDRMRLIQRETQLEHLVIDGQWTLLVVLDDIRVGDTIEAGYTFAGCNQIRPEGTEIFFHVPSAMVVGRFHLRVDFSPNRPTMGWQAAPDAPVRQETRLDDGRVRWTWEGAQLVVREPEHNQPSEALDYIWIQVSDLADWGPLITRLADRWSAVNDQLDCQTLAEFGRPANPDESHVHQLVRTIQDGFRYLSIDLESGGWIPTSPAVIVTRRYGDCKDLAWLATTVIRSWNVRARPILVGTGLLGRVQSLRPMACLFNHAVLEVEIGGKLRWFDLTSRQQGGDFWSQPMSWFVCGLPVDASATSLISQPGPRRYGIYSVRETFLISTVKDEPSAVEVRVSAEGWQADELRQARIGHGAEGFGKNRLEQAKRRYGKAERDGPLQWRDDRERNLCEIVEVFEIKDAVYADEKGLRALFDVPANLPFQTFSVPDEKPRRHSWSLPRALELRHDITVRSRSMAGGDSKKRRWVQPEFTGTLEEPKTFAAWSKVTRIRVTADEVSIERLPAFRNALMEFLLASTWRLYMPWNEGRPFKDDNFGKLSPTGRQPVACVPPADVDSFRDANLPEEEPSVPPQTVWQKTRRTLSTWEMPSYGRRVALPIFFFLVMSISRTCSSSPSSSSNAPARPALSPGPVITNLTVLPSPGVQGGAMDTNKLFPPVSPLRSEASNRIGLSPLAPAAEKPPATTSPKDSDEPPPNYTGNIASSMMRSKLAEPNDGFAFERPRRGVYQLSPAYPPRDGWIVKVSVDPQTKPPSHTGPGVYYFIVYGPGVFDLADITKVFSTATVHFLDDGKLQ